MERYYQRRPEDKFWKGYWTGYGLGFVVFCVPNIVLGIASSDQDKAEDAQVYNAQLTAEITEVVDEPREIVVHTSDKTVTFRLPEDQECDSGYEVKDDVAHLTGKITCQTTITSG